MEEKIEMLRFDNIFDTNLEFTFAHTSFTLENDMLYKIKLFCHFTLTDGKAMHQKVRKKFLSTGKITEYSAD